MQKKRCTALFGWMGDASAFMRPVKIFPSVETILVKLDAAGRSLQEIAIIANDQSRKSGQSPLYHDRFLYLIVIPSTVTASPEEAANAPTQIRSVLQAQQDAWNRGDIDGFMNGYARSASTVFISEDTIRRGWQTVRDRYRKKYSSRAKMGTLTFSDLEITLLSSDSAVASGRWRLNRANDQPHGRFTLILKRLPEGWRIVHDHTCAAARKP